MEVSAVLSHYHFLGYKCLVSGTLSHKPLLHLTKGFVQARQLVSTCSVSQVLFLFYLALFFLRMHGIY